MKILPKRIITSKLYNNAWQSIEFLMFEYSDRISQEILTKDEHEKLYVEYVAARTAILEKFEVTFDELNDETDRLMDQWRRK